MNEGPLSPNETRDLLARLSHMPKKWLGQNFLMEALEKWQLEQLCKVQQTGPHTVVNVVRVVGELISDIAQLGLETGTRAL